MSLRERDRASEEERIRKEKGSNSYGINKCLWGSTTATTATSSSRTPRPPASATCRVCTTTAPAPYGTTLSKVSSLSLSTRIFWHIVCRYFLLPSLKHSIEHLKISSSPRHAEPHGAPLFQPYGSLAKGVCHHFVRTVKSFPILD